MIQENISLKPFNTFGIDVKAKQFAVFDSVDRLREILEFNKHAGIKGVNPLLMLGGGSNILFTRDVNGLVLKNEIMGIEKTGEDEQYVYIKAGAGVAWHSFVLYCLEHDYAGVENLALIPGNVGASPMQNIGAYGVELKDVFHSLEALHLEEKKTVAFNKAECAFGYRESVFKNKYKNQFAITSVTYRLSKKPFVNISYGAIEAELEKMNVTDLNIRNIANAVMNIRRSKLPDPALIGNAGSFFKNPEINREQYQHLKEEFPGITGYELGNGNIKLAAGWLIEHSGPQKGISWKGYRKDDAGCHEKQALVLVNHGRATGSEIYNLSEEILQSVKQQFGVQLEREVNIY